MNVMATVMDLTGSMLGYVPFRDPLPTERYWLLWLVPLVIGLSVVYKTLNLEDLSKLPREATVFALKVFGFMVCAVAILWSLTDYL